VLALQRVAGDLVSIHTPARGVTAVIRISSITLKCTLNSRSFSVSLILAEREVTMDWHDHITVDPEICHGKACIRGTRIPVAIILASLAAGESGETIRETYPVLTADAIRASLAYASELASERVILLPD
jgi:uncharacterized protein (DUF433 family)